jgi:hypothetical protein
MKKFNFAILFWAVFFSACNQPNPASNNNNDKVISMLDSLRAEIKELKERQQKVTSDTLSKKKEITEPEKSTTAKQIIPKPEKPKPEKKTQPPAPRLEDTLYYKYTDGKLSVKKFPRHEGRSKILIYDRQGNITIELEEVVLSYSVSYNIKFREDGSVNNIHEHTNPGASMYWYDCNMTFSNNNEPEWRKCEQHPMRSLEHPDANKYYWDKKTKQWIKQEIVYEQPVIRK